MLAKVSIDIISISSIVGISCGLLLSGLIILQFRKNKANLFLALAMLSFSMSIIYGFFHNNNMVETVPWLLWVGFPFQLLQGPAIFLYVKKLIESKTLVPRRFDILHFVPFFAYVLWLLPFYFTNPAKKNAIYTGVEKSVLYGPVVLQISGLLIMIQIVLYIVVIVISLIQFHKSLKQFFSSVKKQQLSWLLFFCIGYAFVWGLFILVSALGGSITGVPLADFLPVLVTAAILFVGIRGMQQDAILLPESFSAVKYSKSTLMKGEIDIIKDRLAEQLNVHHVFTDSELSLGQLANIIHCPVHHLSQVINQVFNTNFNEFINKERVQLAANRLLQNKDTTILQIAMDSGFGTKASFNSFFKKTFKMTPSEYRKLNAK